MSSEMKVLKEDCTFDFNRRPIKTGGRVLLVSGTAKYSVIQDEIAEVFSTPADPAILFTETKIRDWTWARHERRDLFQGLTLSDLKALETKLLDELNEDEILCEKLLNSHIL